jgi:DNA-binding response OmpR family regulator
MSPPKRIGRILLQQRAISAEELERALAAGGGRLASRLAAEGKISSEAALKALSEQHGIPGIDLDQICLRLEDLELLPREIAEKHLILIVLVEGERLFVAMANPRERKVLDELEFVSGKKVFAYVALEAVIARVIREAYARKAAGESHFVGASCPPEVLRKMGVRGGSRPPLSAPGVVVDDQVGRASRTDEVEDSEFGQVSADLSVVSNLPEGARYAAGAGRSVMVVDDEPEIRKLLERLLTSRGYRVLLADRGLLALRMVKEHVPDLIVLDAMLPEVHGFDIARRIKKSARYGKIPIIMVSAVYRGWRGTGDLEQSLGVDCFIEKPFRIGEVVAAVERLLGAGAARAGEPERGRDAVAALEAGVEAYRAGRLDDAVEHLRRGIEIDPLAYRLHFHLGLLYGRQGQVYEAIRELETAVEINARHFPAVKNLAILYQKAGLRNKATQAWERGLALAPDEATREAIQKQIAKLS